jgi:CRISPR-associated endoribonuclease Cas6
MRIKIILSSLDDCILPINYYHQLSSVIYDIIAGAPDDYIEWLGEKGYLEQGKPKRLFVFSNLDIIDPYTIKDDCINIAKDTKMALIISSPMLEDFRPNFVLGLFADRFIRLGIKGSKRKFVFSQISLEPRVEFKSSMRFKPLSPITISTTVEIKGQPAIYYFRPHDAGVDEAIRNNLIRKYEIIHGKEPENKKLQFTFDDDYIQKKGGYDRITRLLNIYGKKNPDSKEYAQISIRTFLAPFILSGSVELIQTAYECGIGEKNSMGFGMMAVQSMLERIQTYAAAPPIEKKRYVRQSNDTPKRPYKRR